MFHLLFSRLLAFLLIIPCFCLFSTEENFLLINGVTDEVITEMGPYLNQQLSPCSSFKFPLALMGYDAEVLKDEVSPVWNFQKGYDDLLEIWKAPQTPSSWMKYSCVWYSKVLSVELGLKKIQDYLTAMQYGNQDASGGLAEPGPLDPFWINSSLKISAKEQVDFIQKMMQGQVPFSAHSIEMTKAVMFKEELSSGWKLFGKTGWSGSSVTKDGKTLQHSWFVGWIEKNTIFYPFAYLIRGKEIDLDRRIPRVKELLIQSNVMANS